MIKKGQGEGDCFYQVWRHEYVAHPPPSFRPPGFDFLYFYAMISFAGINNF